jgi:hypothetical protein
MECALNHLQLKTLWDEFIEYPNPDNTKFVTTTSALLFAEHACSITISNYHDLLQAAINTIKENGHLADGDICTLRELRDAVYKIAPDAIGGDE